MEKAGPHLKGGTKKVIISAFSADTPCFVMGMNSEKYTNSLKLASSASCTMNCSVLAEVVLDNFGIKSGFITTVQAITTNQKIMDGLSGKLWCDEHWGAHNVIPAFTGIAKAMGEVIPE